METIGSQVFVTKAVHCHRCMARIFGTGQQFSLGTDTYALECEFESKLARMVELGMARRRHETTTFPSQTWSYTLPERQGQEGQKGS